MTPSSTAVGPLQSRPCRCPSSFIAHRPSARSASVARCEPICRLPSRRIPHHCRLAPPSPCLSRLVQRPTETRPLPGYVTAVPLALPCPASPCFACCYPVDQGVSGLTPSDVSEASWHLPQSPTILASHSSATTSPLTRLLSESSLSSASIASHLPRRLVSPCKGLHLGSILFLPFFSLVSFVSSLLISFFLCSPSSPAFRKSPLLPLCDLNDPERRHSSCCGTSTKSTRRRFQQIRTPESYFLKLANYRAHQAVVYSPLSSPPITGRLLAYRVELYTGAYATDF